MDRNSFLKGYKKPKKMAEGGEIPTDSVESSTSAPHGDYLQAGLPDPKQAILSAINDDGKRVTSTDGGKTWNEIPIMDRNSFLKGYKKPDGENVPQNPDNGASIDPNFKQEDLQNEPGLEHPFGERLLDNAGIAAAGFGMGALGSMGLAKAGELAEGLGEEGAIFPSQKGMAIKLEPKDIIEEDGGTAFPTGKQLPPEVHVKSSILDDLAGTDKNGRWLNPDRIENQLFEYNGKHYSAEPDGAWSGPLSNGEEYVHLTPYQGTDVNLRNLENASIYNESPQGIEDKLNTLAQTLKKGDKIPFGQGSLEYVGKQAGLPQYNMPDMHLFNTFGMNNPALPDGTTKTIQSLVQELGSK